MRASPVLLAALALAACVDPPPRTDCTGPDVAEAEALPLVPLGRLEGCISYGLPGDGFHLVVDLATSAEELAALMRCVNESQSFDIDFATQSVVTAEIGGDLVVDGLFAQGDDVLVAVSGGPAPACRGVVPAVEVEAYSVPRVTGDVVARTCITVDPEPADPFAAPCDAP